LGDDILFSPRVSPAVFGLGLLETVEEKLFRFAQEQERSPDVFQAGRIMWNFEKQKTTMGRFGWKANQPTLRQQEGVLCWGYWNY